MNNIIPQRYFVTANKRGVLKRHLPLIIWFTGLSGSGKSTLANQLEVNLWERGIHTYTLDGDNIRSGLNKDLGFTQEDRTENLRRIGEVAKLFLDSGTVVIAAFITPLERDRDLIRNIVGRDHFVEVFVNTSLNECERRDVKGLYRKARLGEIPNFTGVHAPYELPLNPTLTIYTERESIGEAVQKILEYTVRRIEPIYQE